MIKKPTGKFRYAFVVFFIFITSCLSNKNPTEKDIDLFINKYQNTNFEEFTNYFIGIRDKGIFEIVYIIQKFELSPYIVKYNRLKGEITSINNFNLKKTDDYLNETELKDLIDRFNKYNFCLLGVDREGNTFINPYKINSHALFFRSKNDSISDKIRIRNSIFLHYKRNWYINKYRD